ncbi:hypothetical protein Lbys_2960 [Leadbetterella byssophila DSM 17132]|uniref:LiaF transmembrane domain-containing protein n=1 Tax=Leadbetterella byssophila (strain DSM 17132 / JCM 16389 / KACC 11308 / NBRC 106382 / 4M15) TaxID=649349 RepID=E4RT84_LEAB4|nr:DUF5668 domain-containing protein [Leadbetterella byssophila]ADQ18622.1 hypothetical protein Lbys_2960 [Leadbetterella byssophila DSM 17132]
MKSQSNATYFWALIFIAGGGIFLMRNFGLLDFNIPVKIISWRLIPLIIGINALLKKDYFSGIIGVAVSIIFYIPDFLSPEEKQQYYKLWPLLLVGIGAAILSQKFFPNSCKNYGPTYDDYDQNTISESNFLAGSSKKMFTKGFKGGNINCVMGGSEIDLTEAELADNAVLKVFILMGGVGLKVPKEWNVKFDLLPILGGAEDKITKYPENTVKTDKTLVISGNVVMGGVEIKRV